MTSGAQQPARSSKRKTDAAKTQRPGTAARVKQAPMQPEKPAGQKLPAGKNAAPQPSSPLAAVPEDAPRDILVELWLRFGRFGWDVLGVGLLAFAAITLIGQINFDPQQQWNQGLLLSLWAKWVAQGLGYGWPLAVLYIAALGALCLRRRQSGWPRLPWGRIVALEICSLCVLAFLSILGGWSLERIEAGMDGGRVGWGLAVLLDRVLPGPAGAIALITLSVGLLIYGSGMFQWSMRRLERWLDVAGPDGAGDTQVSVPEPTAASAASTSEPSARPSELPPLTLLLSEQRMRPDEKLIEATGHKIEETLSEFGVPAHVRGYRIGPTVTQFAVEPGFVEKPGPDGAPIQQKVRVSQISALSRDLALALSAERLRIEAPVPGRSYVGIEVPNPSNTLVRLRPLMESEPFRKLTSPLAIALGRDVSGNPLVTDLARMPHLLIAGTTGSGKSICISAIATCLVTNNTPDQLRMAMLDPKMVELARFNGLPHLFGRVETELERMLGVLRWALAEMDRRYRLLEEQSARDIEVYNRKIARRNETPLPRIVVIVDELADLMMTAPDQTEHSLIRLAQMARATGIHLVVATQRPSTDVVTGLIKANFPARLAFTVASSIDSRVILDTNGAETLLGKGDMLFLDPQSGTPARAQGVLVGEDEVERVIAWWKTAPSPTTQAEPAPWEALLLKEADEPDSDALIEQAIKIVRTTQRASTSLIQRRLRIGYPRAARLMDELEERGVVGPTLGGGKEREVLLPPSDDDTDDADDLASGE